jgi:hypothetical protein
LDLRSRLADFARLAGADSFYARRVFEHAAAKLLKLAEAYGEIRLPEEARIVCRKARALAPPESEELAAIEAKLVALGAAEGLGERSQGEYEEERARELGDAGAPRKLFKDDPKGGKTFDSYTRKDDRAGCLTSAGVWLVMVVACFGLQRCGAINLRSTRTNVNLPPPMNVRPNLNFEVNYNFRPVNIPPLKYPTPLTTRTPRERRRRTPNNVNAAPAPPPTTVERATPARE